MKEKLAFRLEWDKTIARAIKIKAFTTESM